MERSSSDREFGWLLRTHRMARGLTQETLAERAEVGVRTIQGLERGDSVPQRATLLRLSQALALSPPEHARFEAAAPPAPRGRGTLPSPGIDPRVRAGTACRN
ncbi:MAG TPA: helix-turn-helix transcriptional regulator [Chloroflexota bacterium]|nr:helix-turn-helix transcriptional regulator [Chloroflexota bacterium]